MRASARKLLVPFFTSLVWWGSDSNAQPPAPKAEALPTELSGRSQETSTGDFDTYHINKQDSSDPFLLLYIVLIHLKAHTKKKEADCRSRGREFDPGPVPYFRGD